jgi:WD40 repeat protein
MDMMSNASRRIGRWRCWQLAATLLLAPIPGRAQQPELVLQRQVPGAHAGFSRDGRYFATTSPYGRTLLWETASGRLLRELPVGNQYLNQDFATGGSTRGDRFGSGGYDVVFSSDGRYLATVPLSLRYHVNNGSWSGSGPVVWDLATGDAVAARGTWELRDSMLVKAALPWTGSELIAWGQVDSDAAGRRLRAYRGPARAFSRDGTIGVATDSAGGNVTLLAVPSNRVLQRLPADYRNVWALALRGDGRWLALPDAQGDVQLWDLAVMRPTRLAVGGETVRASVLHFSADGRWLAAAHDRRLRIFSTRDWSQVVDTTFGNYRTRSIGDVAFSPDGRYLAVSGEGLRVLELPSGRVLHDRIGTRVSQVGGWALGDTMLAVVRAVASDSTSFDETAAIEVWSLRGGDPWTLATGLLPVAEIAFDPTGGQLAASTIDDVIIGRYTAALRGDVHLWNLAERRHVLGDDDAGTPAHDIRFAPDGRSLFVERHVEAAQPSEQCPVDEYCGPPDALDYDVVLTRMGTRTLEEDTLLVVGRQGANEWAEAHVVPAADRVLVRTDAGGAMLDLATRRPLPSFRPDSALRSDNSDYPRGCTQSASDVRFSPDGARMLVLNGGVPFVVDAVTGRLLTAPDAFLRTYDDAVEAGAFGTDGTLALVLCSAAVEPGSRLLRLRPGADTLPSIHFDDVVDDVLLRGDGTFFTRSGNAITLHESTGVPLATLLRSDHGDWLIATPAGQYDGSARGVELAAWRVDQRLLPFEQAAVATRVPGLLGRLLAGERFVTR